MRYESTLLLPAGDDPNETFSVQYAKSNRSGCHGCDALIDKDTLRLSRKNYTSRRARRYGPTDEWYHVDCFNQLKKDLGFFGTAESFVFSYFSVVSSKGLSVEDFPVLLI